LRGDTVHEVHALCAPRRHHVNRRQYEVHARHLRRALAPGRAWSRAPQRHSLPPRPALPCAAAAR
jgi:hypothetical protein